MEEDLTIFETLQNQGFSSIDIHQISNYLETLDYDLKKTKFIGKIVSKNGNVVFGSDNVDG